MPTSYGIGQFTNVLTIVGTALTTAYTANRVEVDLYGAKSAVFYIDYTKGGETSLQVQVEVYDADNGWKIVPYTETALAFELSKTATGKFRYVVLNLAKFESKLRVSAKSTGATNGTTAVTVAVNLESTKLPTRV